MCHKLSLIDCLVPHPLLNSVSRLTTALRLSGILPGKASKLHTHRILHTVTEEYTHKPDELVAWNGIISDDTPAEAMPTGSGVKWHADETEIPNRLFSEAILGRYPVDSAEVAIERLVPLFNEIKVNFII